jgi:glycine betaine/proline transport system substrate-binding protein
MFGRKIFLILLVSFVVIALFITSPTSGFAKGPKHVVMPNWGWSADFLAIYITKVLLEGELGYTLEAVELSDAASCVATGTGEVQLNMFLWFPNSEPAMKKYLDAGTAVNLGVLYGDLQEGEFVSKWVSEKYGIKSLYDLDNPEYAKLFDDDGDGFGDLYGCDPGWMCAKINDKLLAGYGLDKLYKQVVGSMHLLKAATIGRLLSHKPVLMHNFYPNDIFIDYPIEEYFVFLEDPLEFYSRSYVPKLANKKWVDANPKAAELVRQMKITGEDVMWAMRKIRKLGDDPKVLEGLAREWIKEHQSTVDSWLKAIK